MLLRWQRVFFYMSTAIVLLVFIVIIIPSAFVLEVFGTFVFVRLAILSTVSLMFIIITNIAYIIVPSQRLIDIS